MILTSSWFLYLFLFFSTLYATSNIFFLYLIHARFLLHLWFTRSLKKDWSLCSVARQFLLRVASNLHSAIQLTSVAEHKTWMWIEQITFLTLFLFASSLSRCGQQSLNKFFYLRWEWALCSINLIHMLHRFGVLCSYAKKKCKQKLESQTIGHHRIKGVEKSQKNLFRNLWL